MSWICDSDSPAAALFSPHPLRLSSSEGRNLLACLHLLTTGSTHFSLPLLHREKESNDSRGPKTVKFEVISPQILNFARPLKPHLSGRTSFLSATEQGSPTWSWP